MKLLIYHCQLFQVATIKGSLMMARPNLEFLQLQNYKIIYLSQTNILLV